MISIMFDAIRVAFSFGLLALSFPGFIKQKRLPWQREAFNNYLIAIIFS
jgi:hypothetical protein